MLKAGLSSINVPEFFFVNLKKEKKTLRRSRVFTNIIIIKTKKKLCSLSAPSIFIKSELVFSKTLLPLTQFILFRNFTVKQLSSVCGSFGLVTCNRIR